MYIGFYLNAATTKPGVGLQIYLILFCHRKYAFKQTNKQTNKPTTTNQVYLLLSLWKDSITITEYKNKNSFN